MHTPGGREGERAWRALRWQSQQGGAQWDPRRAPALGPTASPLLWPPSSDRGLGDTFFSCLESSLSLPPERNAPAQG